jgi:hypothetical protein
MADLFQLKFPPKLAHINWVRHAGASRLVKTMAVSGAGSAVYFLASFASIFVLSSLRPYFVLKFHSC